MLNEDDDYNGDGYKEVFRCYSKSIFQRMDKNKASNLCNDSEIPISINHDDNTDTK